MPFANPLMTCESLLAGRRAAEQTLANWAILMVDPSGSTLTWCRFSYEVASTISSQRPPDHLRYRAEYLYRLSKSYNPMYNNAIYEITFRVHTSRQVHEWYKYMRVCRGFFDSLSCPWDSIFSQTSIETAQNYLASIIPGQAAERGAYYQLAAATRQLSSNESSASRILTEEMMARSEEDALAFMRYVVIDWLARYNDNEDFYSPNENWSLNQCRGYFLHTMAENFAE